jgi:hypothetical protein
MGAVLQQISHVTFTCITFTNSPLLEDGNRFLKYQQPSPPQHAVITQTWKQIYTSNLLAFLCFIEKSPDLCIVSVS